MTNCPWYYSTFNFCILRDGDCTSNFADQYALDCSQRYSVLIRLKRYWTLLWYNWANRRRPEGAQGE